MKNVRFGIVGVEGIGGGHAKRIVAANSRQFSLSAVADIIPEIARKVGDEFSVPYFTNSQEMFDSGLCDAVIIATPHYWHAPLTIRAARAALHVLCEKPLAVTVGPARAMIDECRKHKVALGAMLQHRTQTIMKKMKQLIDSGRLGEIFRISMTCSNWYRSQRYYDGGDWRGTWDGEGGGILLNQAPHSLDLFQWIGGLPKQIIATVGTRAHRIEVENTANVICLYDEPGKTGYIYATTAEAPGLEQLMVCGDKGTLIAQDGKLRLGKLKVPISKHIRTTEKRMRAPECSWSQVKTGGKGGGRHVEVIRAFAKHLLHQTPLIASGTEAINELEISNAVYLAGFKNKTVKLPVDTDEIDHLLSVLERKYSTGKGGGMRKKSERELRRLLGK